MDLVLTLWSCLWSWPWVLGLRSLFLVFILDFARRLWSLNFGLWVLDFGLCLWSLGLDFGLWYSLGLGLGLGLGLVRVGVRVRVRIRVGVRVRVSILTFCVAPDD